MHLELEFSIKQRPQKCYVTKTILSKLVRKEKHDLPSIFEHKNTNMEQKCIRMFRIHIHLLHFLLILWGNNLSSYSAYIWSTLLVFDVALASSKARISSHVNIIIFLKQREGGGGDEWSSFNLNTRGIQG